MARPSRLNGLLSALVQKKNHKTKHKEQHYPVIEQSHAKRRRSINAVM